MKILNTIDEHSTENGYVSLTIEEYETLKKNSNALKIIVEKGVDMGYVRTALQYNKTCKKEDCKILESTIMQLACLPAQLLNKDEFDLVKEVSQNA